MKTVLFCIMLIFSVQAFSSPVVAVDVSFPLPETSCENLIRNPLSKEMNLKEKLKYSALCFPLDSLSWFKTGPWFFGTEQGSVGE